MKFLILSFALLLLSINLTAQQLAFPTAEGAGKYTKGGRGTVASPTKIFYVTNLNDDGLVGSLRYALAQSATNRTVVFSVSGTIHLNSNLSIKANTTIAGQTAPAGGICIADYPVSISGDNIIVRYIRFRLGDKNQLKTTPSNCGVPVKPFTASCMPLNGSGGDDAFGGTGRKNIIIDHCTMSWSNDEACSIYSGDSTTIQWCMLSEPLNYSYHFETGDTDFERHGYGGIWGGRAATFHHNLFAHCQGRACRFDGSRNLDGGTTAGKENCEFSNNVIYNWGAYNVNGGEGGNYNIRNNYYKYGLSTSNKKMTINPGSATPLPWGKYFMSGNYVDGNPSTSSNNWLGAVVSGGSLADTTTIKVTTPFPNLGINLQAATDAYNSVLAGVGASLPIRDTLDERIVNNVKNRTGKIIDVQGNYPHATTYSLTATAWPTLATGNISTDTDQDGMPNWWETRNGLNISIATDRNTVAPNGYTNLENYIDSIPAWNNHAIYESFTGSKLSSTLARFYFNTNWVKDGFTYSLFSSNDSLGTYTKVASVNSSMNNINFTIDDNNLPASTTYYKVGSYKIGVTPDTLYTNIIRIDGIVTPVKFTNYNLKLANEKQIINSWTTVTEVNTSHFNIQRSINGKNFESTGKLDAKGFGASYSFIYYLSNNLNSTIYYRLEVVDFNGTKTYSDIKSIRINNTQTISVFPNPAKNNFSITHKTALKNATINIVNEEGKICLTKNIEQGANTTFINTSTLLTGNYFVVFNNGNETSKTSLIIAR